jgi:16S rRNA (cytidine1402-2'-O)-methyltransferase
MSKRAIETLNQVDFVYCEDTRTSGVLFSELGLQVKTRSLHKFNELAKVDEIKQLLAQGLNIALVSDAGVPGINDPGMYLLHELGQDEQLNYNLTAVGAGPAYVHALIASGFFFEKTLLYWFFGSPRATNQKRITQHYGLCQKRGKHFGLSLRIGPPH